MRFAGADGLHELADVQAAYANRCGQGEVASVGTLEPGFGHRVFDQTLAPEQRVDRFRDERPVVLPELRVRAEVRGEDAIGRPFEPQHLARRSRRGVD